MAMAPVIAEDDIRLVEGHADTHCASLLADTQVGGPGDQPLQEQLIQPHLEGADEGHLPIGVSKLLGGHGSGRTSGDYDTCGLTRPPG
jgi:hypothetical protein